MNKYSRYVRLNGESIQHNETQKCVCFVAYSNELDFQEIISDSFQYHLGLDIEYMKQNHRDHFFEPHNCARAIALYHYFRENFTRFNDSSFEIISNTKLPSREPDSKGENFSFWYEKI